MSLSPTISVQTDSVEIVGGNLPLAPLDPIRIRVVEAGTAFIRDSMGRRYGHVTGPNAQAEIHISGALGRQWVCFEDAHGRTAEVAPFDVAAETAIDDEGGVYKRLLYMLKFTASEVQFNKTNLIRTGGRIYRQHVVTSRDTIHALKAMVYFTMHMKDVVDLFSANQREDGMIYDFAWKKEPGECFHYEWRMPQGYTRRTDDDYVVFARQLVENDLEHMFIRGIYHAWQATGDDYWMMDKLDAGLAAMRFSRTNPYFWSEKYQLLKRAYTSDTWDFQSLYDTERVGGDIMLTDLEKTVFGVMHGDNTGMADSCRKLAFMLRRAGRDKDAEEAQQYADHLQQTVDKLAWNGEFYTHHVSEDPSFTRDFGVDESSQVSLSNAYNLNRGIDHEKAVAVIKTYQRIRREMPAESVGEWYHIYPPFERGWHIPKWDYTNGGLKTIVAGELAHGAFEHGFEAYGADILQRVHDIGAAHADRLFYGFTGGIIPRPKTNFQKLDLSGVANLEYRSRVTRDAVAWCDEDALGLDGFPAGTFDADGVPFDLIDPEQHNGRGGVALCHSAESALPVDEPGTAQSKAQDAAGPAGPADNAPAGPSAAAAPDAEAGSTSPTGPNAGSAPYEELTLAPMSRVHALYLLHACDVKEPGVAGEVEFRYADGGSERRLVLAGRDVLRWMQQRLPEPRSFFVNHGEYRNPIIAWQGRNRKYPTVVVTATGINNPHPARDLAGIVLRSSPEGARWNVLAATVADQPAFFPMKDHSAGAPANWGAGALTYALMEGLVGVVDTDRNYESATVSPRWDAAGVSRVTATAKYAEGGGYVSYSLRRSASTLELDVAASGPRRRIRILLPAGTTPGALYVNGEEANYETETVEDSTYACFSHDGVDSIRARLTVS